jgi:hypothetical protein
MKASVSLRQIALAKQGDYLRRRLNLGDAFELH